MTRKIKILYLVTEDWYFCSHRLPLARAAKLAGFEVSVATRVQNHSDQIRNAGVELIPLNWRRKSKWPWIELRAVLEIIKVYRSEKPDIVHHVALKPVVYGSIAARLAGITGVVNAVAGLGFVFVSKRLVAKFLRPVLKTALKFTLRGKHYRTIVQNPDDRDFLQHDLGIDPQSLVLIRGSGVDLSLFVPQPEPEGMPVIILASRLIKEKGIWEFVEAAALFKSRKIPARFILLGAIDKENPNAIPEEQIIEWAQKGWIEWQGHRQDMPAALADSHIVCLPSYYGEGIPKILIEAAACARPIVTTDVPGCREVVKQNVNGFLVPILNSRAVADAIQVLVDNAELRREMGQRSREIAKSHFSIDSVVTQTKRVYSELLASIK